MCLIQGMCLMIIIFLYMYSHLGFVIAIFEPKFYNHFFSSCVTVVTGVPHPPAVTQSVGETATEKCHVLYIPG